MKEVVRIREPEVRLGDLEIEDVPAYLVPARAAADAILGMALYRERRLEAMIEVVWFAQRELEDAERLIGAAMQEERLEGEREDDGADGPD